MLLGVRCLIGNFSNDRMRVKKRNEIKKMLRCSTWYPRRKYPIRAIIPNIHKVPLLFVWEQVVTIRGFPASAGVGWSLDSRSHL